MEVSDSNFFDKVYDYIVIRVIFPSNNDHIRF